MLRSDRKVWRQTTAVTTTALIFECAVRRRMRRFMPRQSTGQLQIIRRQDKLNAVMRIMWKLIKCIDSLDMLACMTFSRPNGLLGWLHVAEGYKSSKINVPTSIFCRCFDGNMWPWKPTPWKTFKWYVHVYMYLGVLAQCWLICTCTLGVVRTGNRQRKHCKCVFMWNLSSQLDRQ